jgi:hypothetical protein
MTKENSETPCVIFSSGKLKGTYEVGWLFFDSPSYILVWENVAKKAVKKFAQAVIKKHKGGLVLIYDKNVKIEEQQGRVLIITEETGNDILLNSKHLYS